MFWFFGHEACGILAPWPGIEPTPPALEGEVLTTGLPGKSPERRHFGPSPKIYSIASPAPHFLGWDGWPGRSEDQLLALMVLVEGELEAAGPQPTLCSPGAVSARWKGNLPVIFTKMPSRLGDSCLFSYDFLSFLQLCLHVTLPLPRERRKPPSSRWVAFSYLVLQWVAASFLISWRVKDDTKYLVFVMYQVFAFYDAISFVCLVCSHFCFPNNSVEVNFKISTFTTCLTNQLFSDLNFYLFICYRSIVDIQYCVSGVQQNDSVIHMYISIFFSFFRYSYCKILNIVPCAIQ